MARQYGRADSCKNALKTPLVSPLHARSWFAESRGARQWATRDRELHKFWAILLKAESNIAR